MSTAWTVTRRAGLTTLVAAAIAVPLIGTVRADAVRHETRLLDVMTFNLRYASSSEPNSWQVRRPVMRDLLLRAAPDIIGTQEGLYGQLQDIKQDLAPHYDWIGSGRKGGSHDEETAIFYDTRRLAPVEYDQFWLSDTPSVIGSNTWGGAHPRIATWIRFRDLGDDGRQFYVLNTHLDNASQYARERAATLIAERLARLDRSLPLVVTGDFNTAAYTTSVYATMLAAGLRDTWDAAAGRGQLYGTFHGYRALIPEGNRIDWILVGEGVTVRRTVIDTFSENSQFPSDHLPVQSTISLG
ncbi:Metal-dependent hydrolase, endonuclease/exonuclease/phosphatase family [Streptomyces sp. 3213]|uniref:endonuclease/exonuclease/phosphatase family protein n=1 Tax=Streptomyces sp. 3213.3 TaxID=1855348 RepID=UPI000897E554|nr:endonuclease/exonuclease/phosphatase family protein [Streptomyces sp. 3213.3]SEE86869.1 Metal-dependent hydrolase, endonuclease/exonuclease/phosphatase family [Streptomyces sp. 3213] [Streptomyces sp. 3213.3]